MTEGKSQEQYVSSRYEAQKESYDSILLRLDPSPTISTIRRFLLREIMYDSQTQTYIRPEGYNPIFDVEGIDDLMAEIISVLTIDNALSYLSENDIRRITRHIGIRTADFLWYNSDRYHIDDRDWTRIYFLIVDKIEIYLRRAKDGKTNESIAAGFLHQEIVRKQADTKLQEGGLDKPSSPFRIKAFGGGRS